ncbi:MAG: class I SAM-dependent methyltransferase, partial [Acidimicrobiia bacterium]
MDDDELDPEIVRYYTEAWDEDARLRSGLNELEFIRTREIVRRHLPEGALRILDVGGGGGVHAEWLLADGHTVHLVDPVPRHVEEARSHLAANDAFSAGIADARYLPVDDASFDVVLLLGPLYHLQDREDRDRTWNEASRSVRPGGLVFAAAISRFVSLLGGLSERAIFDDEFRTIVYRDLPTGRHSNPTLRPEWFTTAYFHRPDEFEAEAEDAGLCVRAVLGVEGIAGYLSQLEADWEDPGHREIIIDAARAIESEPSLLGLGPHLLLVAERPAE